MDPSDCAVCKIHRSPRDRDDWEIMRNELWVLRHHPDPSPLAGWLLLDSLRHIGGPVDFDKDEAVSWGSMVQRVSSLIKKLTHCDRIYTIAFGEGARHLHLHLIPRFGDNSNTKAWALADHYRNVSAGITTSVDPKEVFRLVSQARNLWR